MPPGREVGLTGSANKPLAGALHPVYLLLGDEAYFRDRFLAALRGRVPPAAAEFAFTAADLATTPWPEILDQARTPSLLAPLQVFGLDNAEHLAGRAGAGFAEALAAFVAAAADPPSAILVFIARHMHIPADIRQMDRDDKPRLEKLEAVFAGHCEIVRCAQADAASAARLLAIEASARDWALAPAAGQCLIESSGGDLARAMCELEKLAIYAAGQPITVEMVRALVPEAPSLSADGLWSALARRDRAAALGHLDEIWAAEGDVCGIPLLFQLSRFCRMALLARQARVRDRRHLYEVLPQGLRPPGFAADTVLAIAQNTSRASLCGALDRIQRADVALRSQPLSAQEVVEEVLVQWDRTIFENVH